MMREGPSRPAEVAQRDPLFSCWRPAEQNLGSAGLSDAPDWNPLQVTRARCRVEGLPHAGLPDAERR